TPVSSGDISAVVQRRTPCLIAPSHPPESAWLPWPPCSCSTAVSSSPRPPSASRRECLANRRPRTAGDGLGGPAQPVPAPGQERPLVIDGWLAADAQPGEDVPADRAAPVPPARGHPVVAAPGSDPKEPAGRRPPYSGGEASGGEP